MRKIQDLFDSSKKLNREIESVVTFGANTTEDLSKEIREYVVTDKLHDNYEKVLEDLQTAFNDSSNEVGIWVAGFYGSGKSSFAKYLGLSFNKSLMIDGQAFGEKLMSRIQDPAIAAMHKAIINRHNPQVIMIDLTNKAHAGEITSVSDIVYYETLKQLDITKIKDKKVLAFIDLLHKENKYDAFFDLVQQERGISREKFESNDLLASSLVAQFAPRIMPAIFPDRESYENISLHSAMSEDERFQRLYDLIKKKTNNDKVIFVLDEVGNYIASDTHLIENVQGMMQTFKDRFRGKVWVIATAQQTLTEDNPNAQHNSSEIFTLHARFPISVDIEASDIKEIITKRLLGKSVEGKEHLRHLFANNESDLKLGTHLELQDRSIYNQVLTDENFANLYPFLPVHIDILLALLQKLASRTGGVGLRSVIRLIRDILVDNHLADTTIGAMAGPEHFYDVLRSDMEKNATREIVEAAKKAISVFQGDALAVRICKTIAVMQILDDFNLSFPNLCALLRDKVASPIDTTLVRDKVNEILETPGLTLQEVEGKFQFMTNAILGIQDERNQIVPRAQEKADIMKEILSDMMTPAPSVNIFNGKQVNSSVELKEGNRSYPVISSGTLKMVVQFVSANEYENVRRQVLTDSTSAENTKTLFWLCTLSKDKEVYTQEIVRSRNIKNRHANDTNREIQQYLRGQQELADEKLRQLRQLLVEAQGNSEIIFRGNPQQVTADNYKTDALVPIAKQVFEKYPFANKSMETSCVTKLSNYTDLKSVPDSLNPFKIIKISGQQATIDTAHQALSEIKDYISMRTDASGSDIISKFDQDTYGWSKDTIRYLVALMLKAGMIQIRVGGQDIKVFGPKAVEAMNNTNSFNRITVELNTDGELTIQEKLKAAQALTSLFGCGSVSPINDAIASAANRVIPQFLQKCNRLKDRYTSLGLRGSDIIAQAVNYATKIKESDGGDAAYLLGKDDSCMRAFKYVSDVTKQDDQSQFIDALSSINETLGKTRDVAEVTELEEFRTKISEAKEVYNSCLNDPDLYTHTSDVLDLKNQVRAEIEGACVSLQTEANKQINAEIERLRSLTEYASLTAEQHDVIETKLNAIYIDCPSQTINSLQRMANEYMAYFMPTGKLKMIDKEIKTFAAQNATPPTPPANTGGSTGNEGGASTGNGTGGSSTGTGEGGNPPSQPAQPKAVSVKRKLSSRSELQQLITRLQSLLNDVAENDTIEINLTD